MNEEVARRFGENLLRCRRGVRLSQEETAARASLHRTEIGLLEQGKRIPRVDTLVKLMGALAVPADELIGDIHWVPVSPSVGGFSFSSPSQA